MVNPDTHVDRTTADGTAGKKIAEAASVMAATTIAKEFWNARNPEPNFPNRDQNEPHTRSVTIEQTKNAQNWTSQLGHPSFRVRQHAQSELQKLPAVAALPLVQALLANDDSEVRRAAHKIRNNFIHGSGLGRSQLPQWLEALKQPEAEHPFVIGLAAGLLMKGATEPATTATIDSATGFIETVRKAMQNQEQRLGNLNDILALNDAKKLRLCPDEREEVRSERQFILDLPYYMQKGLLARAQMNLRGGKPDEAAADLIEALQVREKTDNPQLKLRLSSITDDEITKAARACLAGDHWGQAQWSLQLLYQLSGKADLPERK